MSINSIYFIIFVAITCILYFIFPKKARWVVLLVSSYIYYYLASSKLIVFILTTTLTIYLAALVLGKIDENTKNRCKTIDDKTMKKEIKHKAKTKEKMGNCNNCSH